MEFIGRRTRRIAVGTFFVLVLLYAFVAGLRTVADFDVGWILAMGRYLVVHHQVPRTEFLSYTAFGRPWSYPVFGGALLYLAYAAGGFAALSWINAMASAAATAIAVGRPRLLSCCLALLAVPAIALRCAPRAELFTTLFFAAFMALLWRHRRAERSSVWLLPLIMLGWVNAHPGFAAGIALLAGYVFVELLDLCYPLRRAAALERLRSAAPWILLTLAATLVNPWGIGVFREFGAQGRLTALQSVEGSYWSGMRLTAASFEQALQLRNPDSSYWWLLMAACALALIAIFRRRFGEALLLAGAACVSIEHLRFQALFAIVVVVLSQDVVFGPWPGWTRRWWRPVAAAMVCAVAALAVVHVADTVSDRSYLAGGSVSTFGTGLSWWYPQRAADFIERNHLPAEMFNDPNDGGYLTLRLGPGYRDYADGRAVPFGASILREQQALVESGPDSPLWTRQADRYGINTILLSLARFGALESVPLAQYCQSSAWKPVYLDAMSIVLVRNLPRNQPWLQHPVDCAHQRLIPPQADPSSARGRAELYNFYANAAAVYYLLERDQDAAVAIAKAEALFDADPNLALLKGQLLEAHGRALAAEAAYRRSLALRPTDKGWYLLAELYIAEGNYPAAARAVEHSAQLAELPAERYRLLGNLELRMRQPRKALAAFDRAQRMGKVLAPLPSYRSFCLQLADGRTAAWSALDEPRRATRYAQAAVRLAPDAKHWQQLAACYAAQGLTAEADAARSRARQLAAR